MGEFERGHATEGRTSRNFSFVVRRCGRTSAPACADETDDVVTQFAATACVDCLVNPKNEITSAHALKLAPSARTLRPTSSATLTRLRHIGRVLCSVSLYSVSADSILCSLSALSLRGRCQPFRGQAQPALSMNSFPSRPACPLTWSVASPSSHQSGYRPRHFLLAVSHLHGSLSPAAASVTREEGTCRRC
jgi:hypothetical protein